MLWNFFIDNSQTTSCSSESIENFVASLEFDLALFVSKTLHLCRFFIVDVVTAE